MKFIVLTFKINLFVVNDLCIKAQCSFILLLQCGDTMYIGQTVVAFIQSLEEMQ